MRMGPFQHEPDVSIPGFILILYLLSYLVMRYSLPARSVILYLWKCSPEGFELFLAATSRGNINKHVVIPIAPITDYLSVMHIEEVPLLWAVSRSGIPLTCVTPQYAWGFNTQLLFGIPAGGFPMPRLCARDVLFYHPWLKVEYLVYQTHWM